MAKKNLNPGADATLVGAAYRSAMANVPMNYGDTLENAAKSYEKTMEAQSASWGNFAKLGAIIGADMMANAKKFSDAAAVGAGLNPEVKDMFMQEIYANKDAQKELGLFGGRFGDRETRKRRSELMLEQKELFAEIDLAAASIKAGTDAVANGMYDADINEPESEMVNAIIKSNLKDNVTAGGNIAKLNRDKKTGKLTYTMYKENGALAENPDGSGKPVTMTIDQFNKSIATNVDDKGAMKTAFNTLNDVVAKAGNGSLDGIYDPQMKQMNLNKLDDVLQTPADLRRAFRTKFGYSNTSFFDDINKKGSQISLDLYNTLLSVTGSEDVSGELALTGVTEGVEDTDNSGGISKNELLNANNYSILAANILGMRDPEVSKEYFKEYTSKKLEEAFKYGHSTRPPANKNITDGKNPYGKGAVIPGFRSEGWQSGATLLTRRNQVENNQPFTGVAGEYEPQDNGSWLLNGEKSMSAYKVFQQEGLLQSGDKAEQYGTDEDVAEEFETNNIDIFKVQNRSSAVNSINNLYDFKSSGYSMQEMPSALGGIGRLFGYKKNVLVVRGPNGGFLSFEDFEKGNIVEYGGDSGNPAPRGVNALTFSLKQDHNSAQTMLKKLQKLVGLAGINENTAMPMTPVVGGGGGADNITS